MYVRYSCPTLALSVFLFVFCLWHLISPFSYLQNMLGVYLMDLFWVLLYSLFMCFQRFVNIFFSVYADDSPLYLYVNPIDTYSLAAIMARFRKLYFKLAWKIDFNMLTLCHYIVLCICRWYPVSLDSNQNVENQVPGSSQSWFYQLRNISKVKPISLCCYSVIENHSVKTN